MWSAESLGARERLPGRLLRSSEALGWTSVLARIYEEPAHAEEFTTVATPDHLVVFQLQGSYDIECRAGSGWKRARYRPGSMGATKAGTSSQLRWRSSAPTRARTLHLHLDVALVDEAAREVRTRRGSSPSLPDALELGDPVARAAGDTLAVALRAGADALCADAIAVGLAHRLATGDRPGGPGATRTVRALDARSVQRVVDHMAEHLAEPLELDRLAELAMVSKFYFVRTFAAATGCTPYAYLTTLRLERAAQQLAATEEPLAAIARACGWASSTGLAHAFRRHAGCSPREYRDHHRGR